MQFQTNVPVFYNFNFGQAMGKATIELDEEKPEATITIVVSHEEAQYIIETCAQFIPVGLGFITIPKEHGR